MKNVKVVEQSKVKEFIEKKISEGCLFIYEEYLDKLPWDYFDCLMFMHTQGHKKDITNDFCIVMDDEESEKFFKLLKKDQIEVFVISNRKIDGRGVTWQCMLTKEKVEGHDDPKKLFMGGENLRKFCDEKNIYYKSCLSPEGKLLSGSNLMWQKEEGEDCREPVNKSINN